MSEKPILGYRYDLWIDDSERWVERLEMIHPDRIHPDGVEFRDVKPLVEADDDA